MQQGVIQNFKPYLDVTTLEGAKQMIAMGPVASQEAIKQLGTNGGGFFNANAAHPFENPTPWTNFWSMFTIFVIPSALTYHARPDGEEPEARLGGLGRDVRAVLRRRDHGVLGRGARQSDPRGARHRRRRHGRRNPGGNMEGKEVRFGIANSALYATVTTDASCGAVNSHARLVHAASAGSCRWSTSSSARWSSAASAPGLYGMLVMVVLTVFIAGLMVGRTPEYLGKKIQAREVQMAMLYVLVFPAAILTMTAISAVLPAGPRRASTTPARTDSPRSCTRSRSTAGNNGSAFAGLTGTTYYYNTLLGLNTLIGRFAMMVPMLALAGFLAEKKHRPRVGGHLPGHHAALRRPARRRHPDRQRAHLLSRRSRSARSSSTC